MDTLRNRFSRMWDAFVGAAEPPRELPTTTNWSSTPVGMITPFSRSSIVTKLYNQISLDVSSVAFRHVRVDVDGLYMEDIPSTLRSLLQGKANIDQTFSRFVQQACLTMFEHGSVAIVADETDVDPRTTESFSVHSLRCGRVVQWRPRWVDIELYNDRTGEFQTVTLPKDRVAIAINPKYDVMNKPLSDLQRLVSKLTILDAIDKQSSSGKLNLIIHLPYAVSTDRQKKRTESRRAFIEEQMAQSQYGIAYTDATEKVTQLNTAANNNMMEQVTWLTKQVYSALGITESVFDGTATEATMRTYYNRTVNPILDEIVTTMTAAFISRKAFGQGERVKWFRDPFALVPVSQIADVIQSLKSSEAMTSNEARNVLGFKIVGDAFADELRNSNINPIGGDAPRIPDEEGVASDAPEEPDA